MKAILAVLMSPPVLVRLPRASVARSWPGPGPGWPGPNDNDGALLLLVRPALLALVEDSSRGDPESPLLWTTRSAKHLAGELTAQGHACSPQTAWRVLRDEGFSTQANAKVAEGRRHPDRDAQFRYLAARPGSTWPPGSR